MLMLLQVELLCRETPLLQHLQVRCEDVPRRTKEEEKGALLLLLKMVMKEEEKKSLLKKQKDIKLQVKVMIDELEETPERLRRTWSSTWGRPSLRCRRRASRCPTRRRRAR